MSEDTKQAVDGLRAVMGAKQVPGSALAAEEAARQHKARLAETLNYPVNAETRPPKEPE